MTRKGKSAASFSSTSDAVENAQALKDLLTIPGVGKAIAHDMINIGIRTVEDLKGKDPEVLFQSHINQQGQRIGDCGCMKYSLRAAVYYANHANLKKEADTSKASSKKRKKNDVDDPLYLWYNWTDSKLKAAAKEKKIKKEIKTETIKKEEQD